jgi:hypothetical protein
MATTERPEASAPAASDVAASCRDAGLVRVVGAPRGEALAAVGLLARALDDAGVPFQAGIERDLRDAVTDADAMLAVGLDHAAATHALDADVVPLADAVATELAEPSPILALAGVLATAEDPASAIHEDATAAGVERRPGVAIPTTDPVDGLVHSTLVHGPFSGDREAAAALVAEADPGDLPDPDDRRRLASAVTLAIAADAPTACRAGQRVDRVLRPFAGGPFETVGGYADVLDALARRTPGLGVATVLGAADREVALDAWRTHATAVHRGVEAADARRNDGLEVAEVGGVDAAALEPVARLRRDFRSPEPAVLVLGDARAALATGDDHHAAAVLVDVVEGGDDVTGDARLASIPLGDGHVETAVRAALGGNL